MFKFLNVEKDLAKMDQLEMDWFLRHLLNTVFAFLLEVELS